MRCRRKTVASRTYRRVHVMVVSSAPRSQPVEPIDAFGRLEENREKKIYASAVGKTRKTDVVFATITTTSCYRLSAHGGDIVITRTILPRHGGAVATSKRAYSARRNVRRAPAPLSTCRKPETTASAAAAESSREFRDGTIKSRTESMNAYLIRYVYFFIYYIGLFFFPTGILSRQVRRGIFIPAPRPFWAKNRFGRSTHRRPPAHKHLSTPH